MGRAAWWVALVVRLSAATAVWGQSLEVRAGSATVRLGEPVTLTVVVRLGPGQRLLDLAPRPLVPPPEGVRILSSDSLRAGGDGALHATVRLAFYRPGLQPIPTLGLFYRPAPDDPPDTLVHSTLSIEVASELPAGNPDLKDIKPLVSTAGSGGGVPLVVAGGLVALVLVWRERRRPRAAACVGAPNAIPPDPLASALRRLDELERGFQASLDGAAPLVERVADTVRDCLRAAGAVSGPGLTTPEIGAALPARFGDGGLGDRCLGLLAHADLVKFARATPDRAAAQAQLHGARDLILRWRSLPADGSGPDAVR